MQTTDTNQCKQLVGGSLWWGAMLAMGIASVANAPRGSAPNRSVRP